MLHDSTCGCRERCVPGARSRRTFSQPKASISFWVPSQETGILSTLNGRHLKMGVFPLSLSFSIDSWDLGEKKTNFYFLDYKFVILGIVAFV